MKQQFLILILLNSFANNLQAQPKQQKNNYKFTTFAGGGEERFDGTGKMVRYRSPEGIAIDKNGNLYTTEYRSGVIRKITPDGMVSIMAGKDTALGVADGASSEARFNRPHGIAVDSQLNVYVIDCKSFTVRKITPDGNVKTLAGIPGVRGSKDGNCDKATFSMPEDIAVNSKGYLYIADTYNFVIREISPDGKVKTFAGKAGVAGHSDGRGLQSRFNMPIGIAIDGMDNIYVADADYDNKKKHGNCTIRKISPQGEVTTMAGMPGLIGSADGKGNKARFNRPVGIAVSEDGIVYVADTQAGTIRKITADGTVTTIGGMYLMKDKKDGIGKAARFNDPQAIDVDSNGNLFIADTLNDRIIKGELVHNEK